MLLQLPDQVCQQPGPAVLYLNYGAPPLRPVPHAPLQPRQPAPGQRVKGDLYKLRMAECSIHTTVFTGGVQICDITDRGGHPGHRPRYLLQEPGGRLRPPLQRQRQLVQVNTQ